MIEPFHAASLPRTFNAIDPPLNYDEQLGLTFTQDFSSISYNVTAIQQVYEYGYGPAYLLNGLSNQGYWYQVGISWNWGGPYAYSGYSPGFNAIYAVFAPNGTEVYPTGGGAVLVSLSVNQGDIVQLSLYFSGGNVVMYVYDSNTGVTSWEIYTSQGATYFVGLQNNIANSQGFFTGLMTEQYHANPYYGNMLKVVYSDKTFAKSSAWMWIDEFNVVNRTQVLFYDSTLVLFSNPTQLQSFVSNGATEYSDAYEFITGAIGMVTLTLSYSIQGGGSTYSPPILAYFSNGIEQTATLSTSPTTYYLDSGSTWTVNNLLQGSSSTERWETNQPTSGTASVALTLILVYYHQFFVAFNYNIVSGGSGYSAPTISYQNFGSPMTTNAGSSAWVDAGSTYNYQNPLPGSSTSERWYSPSVKGEIKSAGAVSASFYHQFNITFSFSVLYGGVPIAPQVNYTSLGSPLLQNATVPGTSAWLDAGTVYTYPQALFGSTKTERWLTTSQLTATVSSSERVSPIYVHKYYVTIESNSPSAGSASLPSGWYNATSSISVSPKASAGWKFESWAGNGTGSYSGTSGVATINVYAPINETLVFYPGLRVNVEGEGSVTYSYGSTSGTLSAGNITTAYVPIGTAVALSASPSLFIYSFNGWTGAANSTSNLVSLTVSSPLTVQASFGYNYVAIGGIAGVGAAIVLAAVYFIKRKKHKSNETQDVS